MHHHMSHLVPVLGQVGPDGLDLVVEDVVLLHLAFHQRQVCPKLLAAQLVLVGRRTQEEWVGLGLQLALEPVQCPGLRKTALLTIRLLSLLLVSLNFTATSRSPHNYCSHVTIGKTEVGKAQTTCPGSQD